MIQRLGLYLPLPRVDTCSSLSPWSCLTTRRSLRPSWPLSVFHGKLQRNPRFNLMGLAWVTWLSLNQGRWPKWVGGRHCRSETQATLGSWQSPSHGDPGCRGCGFLKDVPCSFQKKGRDRTAEKGLLAVADCTSPPSPPGHGPAPSEKAEDTSLIVSVPLVLSVAL